MDALTGGPETQLKAKVIEKDPESTIASVRLQSPPLTTPPSNRRTSSVRLRRSRDPVEAEVIEKTPNTIAATLPADGETPPAQGGGLTPRIGVNRLLPHLTGPKTPKPGTTSPTETDPTGTDPTGSVSGTASQTGNSPSLGNIRKRSAAQAGTTGYDHD